MAGIINVSEEESWSTANWAYWGLMDHVIDAFADDPDTAKNMEGCKWMQNLSIPMLREDDPTLAEKAILTLKGVAERCARGELVCRVEGKVLDDASQQQFRESMHGLAKLLAGET